ncbi:hypothetical protein [Epilithonimonas sp. UC225_85]|uniref:hypothetical protein n=1 Tax=Epilithonimonas sp. UC225_85 TaxID=3350167 RepID=UPI0036D244FD
MVRKTTYEEIKSRIEDVKVLISIGVINPAYLRDVEIYERFQELVNGIPDGFREAKKCVTCFYEVIADEFKISSESVRKIIRKLSN